MMYIIFAGITFGRIYLDVYIDNLVELSKSEEDHIDNILQVLH